MKNISLFLISGLLLVHGSCVRPENERTIEQEPEVVEAEIIRSMDYRIPVHATGLLGAATEMKLSFKTGGIIASVSAREGRAVKKGEELARLDLAEIRAQVSQAGIGMEKARRDLDRARNLYRDSVATLEQFQNARSAYEMARSQKAVADFNLNHSTIKAPADGKILKVMVESNELIGSGYPVLLFASTENDWLVRASLTDKDIVRLSLGDTAQVRMDAFPETLFTGEVAELGAVADPVSGTYEVEIMLLEEHPQFRTGFISRVEIWPAQYNQSLVVPVEALVDAGDRSATIFLYRGGRALKQKVATGILLGTEMTVSGGLVEGDTVITRGVRYLRGGERVVLSKVNMP